MDSSARGGPLHSTALRCEVLQKLQCASLHFTALHFSCATGSDQPSGRPDPRISIESCTLTASRSSTPAAPSKHCSIRRNAAFLRFRAQSSCRVLATPEGASCSARSTRASRGPESRKGAAAACSRPEGAERATRARPTLTRRGDCVANAPGLKSTSLPSPTRLDRQARRAHGP